MRGLRWFLAGAVTLALVLAAGIFFFLVTQTDGFSTRVEPSRLERWAARRLRSLAVPARAKAATNPQPDSTDVLAEGQGTRTVEGITSAETTVPSLEDRPGNLSDMASSLTGTVSGPYTATLLTQKLGYHVSEGESYYTPGCTTSAACVFPNAVIPQNAWSAPAFHLLKYIPTPNISSNLFSTSAYPETVGDDKGSGRIDANTPWEQIAGYYFIDNYRLDNPYPGGQGGASIPGFDALTIGRAQMFTLGDTKTLGATSFNEFHAGFLRNVNNIGKPQGGLGVSLQSQGFVTGAGTPGTLRKRRS